LADCRRHRGETPQPDGVGVQREGVRQLDVATLGLGEEHVSREVIVVIEQDVSFDAALGASELSPRKHRKAQRDGGRVQRQQLVLEAEFVFAGAQALLLAEARQRGPEQFFEQGGGAVLVGVGQGGSAGRFGDTEMDQTAQATGQAVADIAQGIGAAQLAK